MDREFQAAAGIAHALIPLSPARAHELLGRSYMLRGEHSFARAVFQRGLELAPGDIELRAYLAHCYFQMGEHHRAIPEAERVLSVDPNHYMLLIRAFSLFHLGVLDSLEAVFERSVTIDPQGQGYGGLHLVSLARGNDEAVAVAERIVAERPEWAQAHADAGHAHYFAGNEVEAIRYLEEAIRLSPNAHVHYTVRSATTPLADLYLKQGRHEEATALLEHAERRAARTGKLGHRGVPDCS